MNRYKNLKMNLIEIHFANFILTSFCPCVFPADFTYQITGGGGANL